MSIIKELFWAYIEGKLNVKPIIPKGEENDKVSEAEMRLGLSDDQIRDFEDFLFEYVGDHEKQSFSAGFKIAFSLIAEIFEIPLDKLPKM